MKTLVVVADLGRFKAFELVRKRTGRPPALEVIESKRHEQIHSKLSEQLTDFAGRFPQVHGPHDVGDTGMSMGEQHNLELEQRRRAIQTIAAELDRLLASNEFGACWLAAPQPFHQTLIDVLRPETRAKILIALHRDLTKLDATEIVEAFETVSSSQPRVA
jgi:hypothetical protein